MHHFIGSHCTKVTAYTADQRSKHPHRSKQRSTAGKDSQQIKKDLSDTLDDLELGELLVRHRGAVGLLTDRIPCDYYDWLKGRPEGLNAYHGEYMRQFDWAEPTWLTLEGKSELWTL